MIILGLPSYHHSGWGLIKDGKIIRAVQEERLNRIKDYPYRINLKENPMSLGIDYLFKNLDINLSDCDAATIPQIPVSLSEKDFTMVEFKDVDLVIKSNLIPGYNELLSLLKSKGFNGKIVSVNHQLSHAAYAYYYSGYQNADILSYDGAGCGDPPEVVVGFNVENHEFRKVFSYRVPHSLGHVYSNTTSRIFGVDKFMYSEEAERFITNEAHGKEGKTMGLAPYGTFNPDMQMLIHDPKKKMYVSTYQSTSKVPYSGIEPYSSRLGERQSGVKRREKNKPWDFNDPSDKFYADLAATAQRSIEEAGQFYVKKLKDITNCENLCLTGGVALNSCLNGKIRRSGVYKSVFAPPACHDGGHGIGAPLYYFNQKSSNKSEISRINNDFLGYPYTLDDCKNAANSLGVKVEEISDIDSLGEDIAKSIIDQKIVAIFRGSSEFGPRALGHRSIMVDPRTAAMKDILNERVKFREAYRPFAPIVLKDHALDYFDFDDSDFMLFVAKGTDRAIKEVPAVIHVDGTARMQTVTEGNEPFYSTLNHFYKMTGTPVLLNTSFNVAGEPIVETPEDAIRCFLGTSIDILYLDNLKIVK